jgi:hypothetical protein
LLKGSSIFSTNIGVFESNAIQGYQFAQKRGTIIVIRCIDPNLTYEKVEQNAKIVINCINELGILESRIRIVGIEYILIELPKINRNTTMNLIDSINKNFEIEVDLIETIGPVIERDSKDKIPIKEDKNVKKQKIFVDSSLYNIEYKMPIETRYKRAGLPVTVKGPSDELALMLTNPREETDIIFISKRDLIDNIETVTLDFGKYPFSEGTYTLTVKTVTPEEVIFKAELWYTVPDINDIQITFGEVKLHYYLKTILGQNRKEDRYEVIECLLIFKNNADLPLFVDNVKLVFNLPGRKSNFGWKDGTNYEKYDCRATNVTILSGESNIRPSMGLCKFNYNDVYRNKISAVTKLYVDEDNLSLIPPPIDEDNLSLTSPPMKITIE